MGGIPGDIRSGSKPLVPINGGKDTTKDKRGKNVVFIELFLTQVHPHDSSFLLFDVSEVYTKCCCSPNAFF